MPESKLLHAALIMPRSEASEALDKIAQLEWFHVIKEESKYTNPDIADLLLRAQKIFQSIDDIMRTLNISEVGIIETMFKGVPKFDTKFTIESIEELVNKLDAESKPIIDEVRALLDEHDKVKKELDESNTLLNTIKVVSNINIELDKLNRLKRFYAAMFVVNNKDLEEIRRSLEGVTILNIPLDEVNTALMIISIKSDAERIVKVLRSFDRQPFTIPKELPQTPNEAFALLSEKTSKLSKRREELESNIIKIKDNIRTKLLSLHESSRVVKDMLEVMRKPAGTKSFAIIQGYIPAKMEDKLRRLTSKWVCITKDATNDDNPPVLLSNTKYINTFEAITEVQGIPQHKEIDPTPIIAFVWPVFYGLMFGDLGHGILLFLLGMLFRVRGLGNLRRWGTLVAASGIGSIAAGLGTGEFFGFHIEEFSILRAIFAPLIDANIIGLISVSELTFEQVAKILEISIAIGIGHIAMAFILKIIKNFKEGNKIEGSMISIPTLIMYGSVVSLILAAIGANYDVIGMFGVTERVHNEPVPWITPIAGEWVTVELVAKAAVPILFACMAMIIIGHIKEENRLKHEGKHEEGAGTVGIVMEVVLIKLIEMLSNTISYGRIAIMLLVHAILLVTVNHGFESLMEGGNTGGAIAMIVGGNIGIMMIEGLIVYIQTIRLHLYEWFPKWYHGSGYQFKKIIPEMIYSSITWKKIE